MESAARGDAVRGPVVYGSDDRREFFEVVDPRARSVIAQSVVALIPKTRLGRPGDAFPATARTWAEVDGLCPGEPFGDQPATAFCTGVLIDWDLVLTAGHCLRLFAVEDMSVVFDYYYEAPGKIATRKEDARDVAEIVAEALDGDGVVPRLDYGWLRLAQDAGPTRRPVPVHVEPPPLRLGASILSMGAGGGVPIKFDAGGRVRNLREDTADYFVADVDTSRGSSGAGAFSEDFALLGMLARGGLDFVRREDGCHVTNRETEDHAMEQFTYAYRAVAALCAKRPEASSLCRPECGATCQALSRLELAGGGCALVRDPRPNFLCGAALTTLLVAILRVATPRVLARRRRPA